MRKGALVFVLVLAALGAALFVWIWKPQQRALEAARREAHVCGQERSVMRSRIADLEGTLAELRETSGELEARVQEKESKLAEVSSTHDELIDKLQQEISEGQVQVERLRDSLRVDVVDEILFDSGQAELHPAGKEVLAKLAGVLRGNDRGVEVQGHTDNVPIRGRLAGRYPTNWELSAARAVNVVRFLHEGAGLDATRLSAAALSEYHARADNATDEGKQKNRRIEIWLVPPRQAELAMKEAFDPAVKAQAVR